MKSSTRVQPEAMTNYKCLFLLDIGSMPAAIQDQHSVPHGMMVSYCSAIKKAYFHTVSKTKKKLSCFEDKFVFSHYI